MSFSCLNEIEIRGGSEEDRRRAASVLSSADYVDDESLSSSASAERLLLRYESLDGLPGDELAALGRQFPELSFLLVYASLDGEFFGMERSGSGGEAVESADFDDDTRELIGRRFDGDAVAFVRSRYSLGTS